MNLEAHMAAGWVLGNLVPGENRRFRGIMVAAAMAPDLDGITYLAGGDVYARWHHVLGHNVFVAAAMVAVAAWLARRAGRRWGGVAKVGAFAGLALLSHWLGDYYLSNYPLSPWWPVSDFSVKSIHSVGLDHPVNHAIGYASLALMAGSVWIWKRTPLEFVSRELDAHVVNLARDKPLSCQVCARPANELCYSCGAPVCIRHARLDRRFHVQCPSCPVPVLEQTALPSVAGAARAVAVNPAADQSPGQDSIHGDSFR